MTAIDDVRLERQRQIDDEGFDSNHDQRHADGALAAAAATYATYCPRRWQLPCSAALRCSLPSA